MSIYMFDVLSLHKVWTSFLTRVIKNDCEWEVTRLRYARLGLQLTTIVTLFATNRDMKVWIPQPTIIVWMRNSTKRKTCSHREHFEMSHTHTSFHEKATFIVLMREWILRSLVESHSKCFPRDGFTILSTSFVLSWLRDLIQMGGLMTDSRGPLKENDSIGSTREWGLLSCLNA